jgi:DNA-binding transcriptional MerR regulator
MSDDTNNNQTIYNSSDVATLLKIQESTLRKYCIMLEEHGYKFHKNEQGHRGYFNNDVIALKRLIEVKNHPDMTLKRACDAVVSWSKDNAKTDHDTKDITLDTRHNEGYNALLKEFEEFKKQQEVFNKQLIEQLQKQQEYIQNSLVERDKTLMESLREVQETKKLIAAAEEKREDESKKGFFQRLFGK